MSRTSTASPRRFVSEVSTLSLIQAMFGDEVFGILDHAEHGLFFICPTCGYRDHNGGTAELLDQWRWRCHKCRRTRTRYLLERLVLEDADYLERLYELVNEVER